MKRLIWGIAILATLSSCAKEKTWTVSSPSGDVEIHVSYHREINGQKLNLTYDVAYKGQAVLLESPLGIDRADGKFSDNLRFVSEKKNRIDETYTLKAGKRLENRDQANETVLTFKNDEGKPVELIVRAYDDGVAYRYRFPEGDAGEYMVTEEKSGFRVPLDGKAWIHPYDWNSRLKPSYEQYCENEIAIGSDSPYVQGWGFPMLFQVNGLWMMITEAVLDGTYCGTHIHSTKDGLYRVVFAEKEEVISPDDPEPVSTLPWATPWRVVMVGNQVADIFESTLVQHLNPPSRIADESWIRPGRSSWNWWSGGSSSNYEAQMQYVDFSADMGWEYVLVDAGWPRMPAEKMEALVKYANSKNVGIWLWYHSGAGQPADTVNHRNVMSFPAERKKEFARIQAMGVKGVKIDFFDTDKQSIVKMYYDILKDAADHRILVNLHGASLPRGLERTWPNLMTTEAIKGAEGFGRQPNCDRAAWHNTTVPFTRNVVGSMDYTPVTFSDKVRQGVVAYNRTTYPHQLALAIVFESGVQNFADKYESYEALPAAPKDFLKKVPTVWDDTKLVAGYPGDYIIVARRKGNTWWIGGINGKEESRRISFELPFIEPGKGIDLLVDGSERTEFVGRTARTGETITVEFAPNGGFTGIVGI